MIDSLVDPMRIFVWLDILPSAACSNVSLSSSLTDALSPMVLMAQNLDDHVLS
ncbi:MAG: hypothetical protein IPP17_30355 [Bacteroidetes bacterium]|nr:hypothetical protein [Bacteroidota bacterium]